MRVENNDLEKLLYDIRDSRPIIVVSRSGQGRDTLVEHLFSLFVAENGGIIYSQHGDCDFYHRHLVCDKNNKKQLVAYFDCNIVMNVERWKDLANDKSFSKILSCQLNSLGVIPRQLIQCLYDAFGTFELIKVEVSDNDILNIDKLIFG